MIEQNRHVKNAKEKSQQIVNSVNNYELSILQKIALHSTKCSSFSTEQEYNEYYLHQSHLLHSLFIKKIKIYLTDTIFRNAIETCDTPKTSNDFKFDIETIYYTVYYRILLFSTFYSPYFPNVRRVFFKFELDHFRMLRVKKNYRQRDRETNAVVSCKKMIRNCWLYLSKSI